MNRLILMTTLLLAGSVSSSAQASFDYEGFDYPGDREGEQLTDNGTGGVGWASAWTGGPFWTNVGSLQLDQLETSGNSVQSMVSQGSVARVSRTASQPLVAPGIETRFLSFLIRANQAGSTDFGGIYLDGATDDLLVGKVGHFTNWGMESSTNKQVVQSSVPVTENETTLLVLKMESSSVGYARFSLYVNPTPGQSDPGSNLAQILDIGRITTIGLFTNANFSFDEIRIGDRFAAVTPMVSSTPEPSVIVLGAVGLAPLLVPRIRRRFSKSCR